MNDADGPLLSVVVPFYGVEDYIGACLESLRIQTLTDLEVICVDDGSPDGSLAIVEGYCARDPRFRLVRQPNAGLGPARNTGVRAASGRYLAFVDSDDLVPARAYELLVGTLERTGSDFAAGGARRFDRERGVRESWTHAGPFARDDLRTHVLRRPDLVGDRMVWNKVYRRDFWDAHGYTFPAIRYEDWPVTLAAHLDAVAVDVLADPVYYWRDRESGESITQAVHRIDNLTDRIASAELVLDRAADAPDEVRWAVQAYLLRVDLTALSQALTVVAPDSRGEVAALGRRLAVRIEPEAAGRRPLVDRLLLRALQRGRVGFARGLATLRSAQTGASGPLARTAYRTLTRSWRSVADLKELTVTEGTTGPVWTFAVQAGIADHPARRTALAAWLVGTEWRTPLAVRVDGPAARTLELPGQVLAAVPAEAWPLHVEVEIRAGRVRRTVPLSSGPEGPFERARYEADSAARIDDLGLVRVSTDASGRVLLSVVPAPALLQSVAASADGWRLSGTVPAELAGADLVAVRPRPSETLRLEWTVDVVGRFEAQLPVHWWPDEVADDPFTGECRWPLVVRALGKDLPLLWAAGPDTATHVGHDAAMQVALYRRAPAAD